MARSRVNTERKTRRDGAETRAAVLEAADRLFAEAGFDGTSLKAISDESGVSPALIQHHFDGKEALWRAAKRRVVERFVAAQWLPDPSTPPTDASVRDAFYAYFRYAQEHPAIIRFGLWVSLRGESGDWGGESEVFTSMMELAERAQRAGLLRDDVPAYDLLLAFRGMVRTWVLDEPHFGALVDEATRQTRSDAYFENALRLIRP